MSRTGMKRDRESQVRKYEGSGETFTSFCKSHGLAPSTFRYHVEKYSKKSTKRRKFYPLVPLEVNPEESSRSKEICLELPHGIRLTIPG